MPWQVDRSFRVVLGGNTFVDTPNLVEYDGESLFSLERNDESGYLAVSFKIYDESKAKIATIGRNRVFMNKKYRGPKTFAIEGGVHDWVLREKPSDSLICAIKQKEAASPAELDLSVNLYTPDGLFFSATPDSINLGGLKMTGNVLVGCRAGIVIDRDGSVGICSS